jgi:hypothetical protein
MTPGELGKALGGGLTGLAPELAHSAVAQMAPGGGELAKKYLIPWTRSSR